jgi:DNA-binding SARP family transcriptional activator/transcriptional regulator with XRE-family HTH domain
VTPKVTRISIGTSVAHKGGMMEDRASFGYWVRRRRKALDLTQAELAQHVGCSVMTIRKIEGDLRRPSRQIAELLAQCLAIPDHEREQFVKVARAKLRTDRMPESDGRAEPWHVPEEVATASDVPSGQKLRAAAPQAVPLSALPQPPHTAQVNRSIQVQLLGSFCILVQDAPIAPLTARLQSLIAYLILRRDIPVARVYLAGLLWPESSDAQARTNLRTLLHRVRAVLPDPSVLALDAQHCWWRSDAPAEVDVLAFEEAVATAGATRAQQEQAVTLAALTRAAALYSGDLLPGCYEDWIQPERERLRTAARSVFASLTTLLEQQREYEAATAYARRWLELDPLDEHAALALPRLTSATARQRSPRPA